MSMHNAIDLHIIRTNQPMHRNAPASVARAVTPVTAPAAIPAVVLATTTHFETTPR